MRPNDSTIKLFNKSTETARSAKKLRNIETDNQKSGTNTNALN